MISIETVDSWGYRHTLCLRQRAPGFIRSPPDGESGGQSGGEGCIRGLGLTKGLTRITAPEAVTACTSEEMRPRCLGVALGLGGIALWVAPKKYYEIPLYMRLMKLVN